MYWTDRQTNGAVAIAPFPVLWDVDNNMTVVRVSISILIGSLRIFLLQRLAKKIVKQTTAKKRYIIIIMLVKT